MRNQKNIAKIVMNEKIMIITDNPVLGINYLVISPQPSIVKTCNNVKALTPTFLK